jgi:DNA processing protein
VQSHGAPAALERLLGGDVPDDALRASVLAKTAGSDPRRQAEASLEQAQRIGARLVVPSDPEWPERVDDLAVLETDTPSRSSQNIRPPLCLWVLGFWPVGETLQRSVAVVGARAATPYGQTVATNIAYGLANHDWTVVAGGSFGIEAAAHRAALAADVRTVAVLACGVDRPYPAGNATLFEQITETGLLISAWPPGSDPLKHRFEFSHRLISAATAGTVLVEAAERTSATQMMHDVLALRRAAMVVPGPVDSAMSAGCHELLRTHPDIRLVTGVPHVLEELDTRSEQDA